MPRSWSMYRSGRMVRTRHWACCVVLGLICALALPTGALAQTPVDDEAAGVAAVVIDSGDDDPVYVVVAFDETGMSAIDLLRAADIPLVTVSFGGLGEGVCSIVQTGCDVSACRRRLCQSGDSAPPFWQYWRQDGEGDWSLSALGGSHSTIEDGDIDTWVWTGMEPELEPLPWEEIATQAGAPERIVNGDVSGLTGVWVSGPGSEGEETEDGEAIMATLISTGILVLLAGAGLLLIRKQRAQTEGAG